MKNIICLAGAFAVLALSSVASADTYKDFNFATPGGWSAYPGRCRGTCLLGEASKARIDIYTTSAASSMAAAKSVITNLQKSQDLPVGGRAGAFAMGNGKAVAATQMGSEYLLIIVEVSKADTEGDIAAWASIVDGGTFASGGSAPPPPPPSNDYGDRPAVKRYTVKLVNNSANCTAQVKFDGTPYELGPSETKVITVNEGDHDFEYSKSAGGTGSGRFNVPKIGIYNAGCQPPPRREPAPQPEQPQGGGGGGDDRLAQWAAILVGNTYSKVFNDGMGVSGATVYKFVTGDTDDCPIVFSMQSYGNSTYGGMFTDSVVGCAYAMSIVDGAENGRTRWRLVAKYIQHNDVKQNVNQLWWEGAFQIYTDALSILSPKGVFSSPTQDKWHQLAKN